MNKKDLQEGSRGAIVHCNDDMSEDEQEMALFEGFLREGYPEKVAAKKAKEWLSFSSKL